MGAFIALVLYPLARSPPHRGLGTPGADRFNGLPGACALSLDTAVGRIRFSAPDAVSFGVFAYHSGTRAARHYRCRRGLWGHARWLRLHLLSFDPWTQEGTPLGTGPGPGTALQIFHLPRCAVYGRTDIAVDGPRAQTDIPLPVRTCD